MPERISKYCLLPAVCIILITSACNRDVVYSDTQAMKNNEWNLMNLLSFEIPVEDTINSNNVYFTLRSGTSYPFRNIYLFVSTISPDGKVISDTLQYFLADESGKWYGKGFGDIKELKLPYKSNVYFPLKGNYRFTVQHGMRIEDLKGVYDFGIRIEKISR